MLPEAVNVPFELTSLAVNVFPEATMSVPVVDRSDLKVATVMSEFKFKFAATNKVLTFTFEPETVRFVCLRSR